MAEGFITRRRVVTGAQPLGATGGTITEITDGGVDYRVHTFTSSGTFEVTSGSNDIDVLVVGGGGSGGTHHGGGGGAGGLVYKSAHPVTLGSYSVVVGDGGDGVLTPGNTTSNLEGNPGSDSTFDGFVALGGGGGNGYDITDRRVSQNGGSGGGGANWDSATLGGLAEQPGTNPTADIDAGNAGYDTPGNEDIGGGGGGAGGAPGGGYNNMDGGAGLFFGDKFGTTLGDNGWFAGGGGAGNYRNPGTNTTDTGFGNGGSGNFGGGGRGGVTFTGSHRTDNESGTQGTDGPLVPEIDGIDGTGGGGGGIPSYFGTEKASGAGGSGIVIVRYPI